MRSRLDEALHQPILEISSDSGDLGEHSNVMAVTILEPLPSTEGLQGATAISEWTRSWWQCLNLTDRKATQAVCYFIRSDVKWYCKAMPMWSAAQLRLLDPEQPESEHGTAFEDDVLRCCAKCECRNPRYGSGAGQETCSALLRLCQVCHLRKGYLHAMQSETKRWLAFVGRAMPPLPNLLSCHG